uniref:Phi1 n=1 Tax=Arundo donax TaxID=35708 RepID=A0A0A9GA99_ARUDO
MATAGEGSIAGKRKRICSSPPAIFSGFCIGLRGLEQEWWWW